MMTGSLNEAMEKAFRSNNVEIARYLIRLSGQADIRVAPDSDWSFVHLAAAESKVEFLNMLLEEEHGDPNRAVTRYHN